MIQLYLIFVILEDTLILGSEKELVYELMTQKEFMLVVKMKLMMMDKLDYKLEVKFDTGMAEVLVNMSNVELI